MTRTLEISDEHSNDLMNRLNKTEMDSWGLGVCSLEDQLSNVSLLIILQFRKQLYRNFIRLLKVLGWRSLYSRKPSSNCQDLHSGRF